MVGLASQRWGSRKPEAANGDTPASDAALAHVARLAASAGVALGDPTKQTLHEARAANLAFNQFWNVALPIVGGTRTEILAGPHGEFPIRIYLPKVSVGAVPAVLYFHGGGFVLNNLTTHDRIMRAICAKTGAAVIGVGYHLAPEHRFPVQLDEAHFAYDWASARAPLLGIDARRFAVAGDSAGATLALSLLLRHRDEGRRGFLTARAGLLFYGMYSATLDSASHAEFGAGPGLTTEKVAWFWGAYLGLNGPRVNALSVPALADVKNLPHLILVAAGRDPLRDDTVNLARALGTARTSHSLSIEHDLPHSFLQQAAFVPAAEASLTARAHELAQTLSAGR